MMRAERLTLAISLLFAAGCFVAGINWGLPSRAADRFLFGERTPWTGADILALTRKSSVANDRGSDVDLDPIVRGDAPFILNNTDARRAEIVQRYRTYSYQPDEMITLRALSQMRPAQLQLDPKLYQYGGLWIYPIGGLLKACAIVGAIDLRGDLAFYLDHPEEFGRFYIVMRAYSAMWGLIGAAAVWTIIRKLTGSPLACAFAVATYALLPVINNGAHEAKPHLQGTALMLWATIAAARYVERDTRREALITGVLCGAAIAAVPTSVWIVFVLPTMTLLRRERWLRRGAASTLSLCAAIVTYAATNPYVILNALTKPDVLHSNLGNTTAMYAAHSPIATAANALYLLDAAMGTSVLLVVGIAGAVVTLFRLPRDAMRDVHARPMAILLIVPALLALGPFFAFAAGKPGEYARFAMFPAVALLVLAVAVVCRLGQSAIGRSVALTLVCGWTWLAGASYVWHFVDDASPRTKRLAAAERIETWRQNHQARAISLCAEPAPYAVPPLNLFEWTLFLPPRGQWHVVGGLGAGGADALISTVDQIDADRDIIAGYAWVEWSRPRLLRTPISWAHKPILFYTRHFQASSSPTSKSTSSRTDRP